MKKLFIPLILLPLVVVSNFAVADSNMQKAKMYELKAEKAKTNPEKLTYLARSKCYRLKATVGTKKDCEAINFW